MIRVCTEWASRIRSRAASIRRRALIRQIDLGKRKTDASLARLERTIRLGDELELAPRSALLLEITHN